MQSDNLILGNELKRGCIARNLGVLRCRIRGYYPISLCKFRLEICRFPLRWNGNVAENLSRELAPDIGK